MRSSGVIVLCVFFLKRFNWIHYMDGLCFTAKKAPFRIHSFQIVWKWVKNCPKWKLLNLNCLENSSHRSKHISKVLISKYCSIAKFPKNSTWTNWHLSFYFPILVLIRHENQAFSKKKVVYENIPNFFFELNSLEPKSEVKRVHRSNKFECGVKWARISISE